MVFLLYEIIIYAQSYAAKTPLCGLKPKELGPFHYFACAAAVSGFFFTFLMLSVRISQMTGQERIPSIVALDIVFKGLLSTIIFVIFNDLNGICIDVNG